MTKLLSLKHEKRSRVGPTLCRKITLAKSRESAKLKARSSVCMPARHPIFNPILKPHSHSSPRQVSLARTFPLKSTEKVSNRYFFISDVVTSRKLVRNPLGTLKNDNR